VAGKTGTAQWGPKRGERTAAWFAGFAPADVPRYAFAALYEGRPNDDSVHGGTHAAPLIGKMLEAVLELEESRTKKAEPVEAVEGVAEEGEVVEGGEATPAMGEPVSVGEDQPVEDGD
jgi:penicillin-binding protein 2